MRSSRLTLLASALLLAAPMAAHAQQPAPKPAAKSTAQAAPKTMTADEFEARVRGELKKIKARLKLTPDQETQLRSLMVEEVDRMDALAFRYEGEARQLLTDSRAKMRSVLTPAQQTEWDKIKVEYQERIRARAEQRPASGT